MQLVIERGKTLPFAELPDHSIALDGYCQGPSIDADRERYSLDHHDGCIRLVTRATCQQTLDALVLGLVPDRMTVYVNDVDGDTALSVALLDGLPRGYFTRELVEAVGKVDAHGPAYQLSGLEQALVDGFYGHCMSMERALRASGKYGACDLRDLLRDCVEKIHLYVEALRDERLDGDPGLSDEGVVHAVNADLSIVTKEPLPYEITHTGKAFVMARSKGFAFPALYAVGHRCAVIYDQLPDESWVYTIGKQSDFVAGFPIGPHGRPGTILHSLASVEPGWGGASTIGGAPRNPDGSRSRLSPDRVFDLIGESLSDSMSRSFLLTVNGYRERLKLPGDEIVRTGPNLDDGEKTVQEVKEGEEVYLDIEISPSLKINNAKLTCVG